MPIKTGLDNFHQKSSIMVMHRSVPVTPRQLQCLGLVTKGLETKNIARLLQLAPGTVDNHIKQAMRAYGVNNRQTAAELSRAELFDFEDPSDDRSLDSQRSPLDIPPEALPLNAPQSTNTMSELREQTATDHITQGVDRWLPAAFKPLIRRAGEGNMLRPGERGMLIFREAMVFVTMFILLVMTLLAFGLVNSWMHSP